MVRETEKQVWNVIQIDPTPVTTIAMRYGRLKIHTKS